MIVFFDIIKIIFCDPEKYKSLNKYDKQKFFFLLSRRFAINFPLQANVLQHVKINQAAVVDFWQRFLRKKYDRIPGWMYTKGVKKSQEVKEKKLTVSNEVIREYCKRFNIDRKLVMDALQFYETEIIKELHEFETILKQK